MNQEEKYIGYLKYSGKSVEDGLLDTRKSAEALLGFDEVLRYFLLKEDPCLKEIDFEIPVRIKKGTWEAAIPEIINKIFSPTGIAATALTIYACATAKKAAKDGLFDTGAAKDIRTTFRMVLKSVQWVIRIGLHIGTLAKKKLENAKVRIDNANQEVFMEISNDYGKNLSIPRKYFDLFSECPEKLFSKNAHIIEQERVLEFGVFEDGKEEKVSITEKEKYIFYTKGDEEDILFPELKHGQHVKLEGAITKGNEKTNTLGFEYQGHILICKPINRNIATFKNKIISQLDGHFFPPIKIIGVIDRTNENSGFNKKKPQIVFSDIIPLEQKNKPASLFDIYNQNI